MTEKHEKQTERQKMISGKLYTARDSDLQKSAIHAKKLTRLFNQTTEDQLDCRIELIKELFGKVGTNCFIEPPFHCDYGTYIEVGNNFYANYDCIIIDVCKVSIGDNVMFGPRVSIFTAGHPIDKVVRSNFLEFGKPIIIGNDVWIGGHTVINPGISIGDNVVIGSGSVVTKNIPSHVIAVGNPCKVLREITESDKAYWESQQELYFST